MKQEQANWEWMDARVKKLESYLEAYKTRIAELEKSAEPVAWMRSGDDQLSLVKGKDDGYMIWQPLYITPQIKELSGDEIHEVAKKFLTSYDLEIDQGLYGDTSRVLIAIEDWYGFARAILKKASEKC